MSRNLELVTINVYGAAKDVIGSDSVQIAVKTAGEAIHALGHQYKGFKALWNSNGWHVVTTNKGTEDNPDPLTSNELIIGIQGKDLHIIPKAEGAIFGFVKKFWEHLVLPLITLPFEAVRKVMQQMMPEIPDPNKWEPAENKPSFHLSRARNTATEGLPIALHFGRIPASGAILSNTQDIVQLDPRIDDE